MCYLTLGRLFETRKAVICYLTQEGCDVFSGVIEADGSDASGGAGGGSGGGILLSTGTLYGKGVIRTNGGKGLYNGDSAPMGSSGDGRGLCMARASFIQWRKRTV